MVKRKISVLLFCVLLISAVFAPLVKAAVNDLKIEQVQVEMPEVQAYFHLNNGQTPKIEEISASLGNHALRTTDLRQYDPVLDATSYFFLVDCSTSVTYAQMEAVKKGLLQFAQEDMDQNSTMTLLSFGVDVQVLLQRETDADIINKAINLLAANQAGTVFFDALAKSIDMASNKAYALERKLAFVFSDSVDYNLGGYTKDEVDKMLAATGLPFYAIGFDTGGKQQLDNFGAVARTSGGDITISSAKSLPKDLKNMVAKTKSAWRISFDAGTNIVDKNYQEFVLALETQGLTSIMKVPVRHWRADKEAPKIESAEQLTVESIGLQFSKPVNGANLLESYAVKNEKGDLLGIKAVAYEENDNTAVLTFSSPPKTGKYTLEYPGIVDRTMEKNKVQAKTELAFEAAQTQPTPEPERQEPLVGAWIFISLLGLAIIGAIARASFRKNQRKQQEEKVPATAQAAMQKPQEVRAEQPISFGEEMQLHFMQTPKELPKIKMQVSGANGQGRVVEVPINKTLFVGRSDICDVYFDDGTMSRQHFVIKEENGRYSVTNLSNSSGTLLNGVKLQKTRSLQDGDTLQAGRQTIVFFSPELNRGVH